MQGPKPCVLPLDDAPTELAVLRDIRIPLEELLELFKHLLLDQIPDLRFRREGKIPELTALFPHVGHLDKASALADNHLDSVYRQAVVDDHCRKASQLLFLKGFDTHTGYDKVRAIGSNIDRQIRIDVLPCRLALVTADYNLLDDVKAAMSGLLAPTLRETFLGNAEVLEVFHISKIGHVAGCRITEGRVERGANVRLIRDNVVIHEGKLSTLKRFKDEVKDVQAGQECGMGFENYHDLKKGDVIECFRVEEIARSL